MLGYVALHRELLMKPVFENEKLLKVWIWCLLKAAHKEHEEIVGLQKVSILQGQFITGRYAGAAEVGMNPSTFWKYLQWLKKNQSLDIKSNNKFSVISLVNWGVYQIDSKLCDNKSNNKMTAKEQQRDTNNNVNNVNKKDIRPITDEQLSLAAYFRDKIKARKPDYKFSGTIEKWATVIRLMIERDGRTAEKIRVVIEWSQADTFWQNNILSPDKLRKQFDRLELEMNKRHAKGGSGVKQYDTNGICWNSG